MLTTSGATLGGSSGGMAHGCCIVNGAGGSANKVPAPIKLTVKDHLDQCIAASRKRTEDLCIRKAKLETLGLLDYPFNDLNEMLNAY